MRSNRQRTAETQSLLEVARQLSRTRLDSVEARRQKIPGVVYLARWLLTGVLVGIVMVVVGLILATPGIGLRGPLPYMLEAVGGAMTMLTTVLFAQFCSPSAFSFTSRLMDQIQDAARWIGGVLSLVALTASLTIFFVGSTIHGGLPKPTVTVVVMQVALLAIALSRMTLSLEHPILSSRASKPRRGTASFGIVVWVLTIAGLAIMCVSAINDLSTASPIPIAVLIGFFTTLYLQLNARRKEMNSVVRELLSALLDLQRSAEAAAGGQGGQEARILFETELLSASDELLQDAGVGFLLLPGRARVDSELRLLISWLLVRLTGRRSVAALTDRHDFFETHLGHATSGHLMRLTAGLADDLRFQLRRETPVSPPVTNDSGNNNGGSTHPHTLHYPATQGGDT